MHVMFLKAVNLLGTVLSKHESAAYHHKQCQKIPEGFQVLSQTTLNTYLVRPGLQMK